MKKKISVILKKGVSISRISVSIFWVLCFISCSDGIEKKAEEQQEPENEVSNIPTYYKSPNASYKRDSLFIVSTMWQFIHKQVSPFHYYATFNIPFDKISVDVDSIMYSPDSLKLFAFVIVAGPDIEHNNSDKYFYSGNSLIGYRTTLKTYWTIYNFDQFSTGGFKKYNSIRKLFRDYFFGNGKFKDDSEYIWDSIKQDRISVKFGYNLDQHDFWDSSLAWCKGARIPGYYNFETVGNVKPGDKNTIKIIPHLDYPDSLLKMYK